MRALYINQETLTANSTLTVRNQNNNIKYLITGRWGIKHSGFSVNDVYGNELAKIIQTKTGMMPEFTIFQNHQPVCKFVRPLNSTSEFFYLPQLHWIVIGNLKKMKYRILKFNNRIMTTKLTTGFPRQLIVSIDTCKHEPLCLCLIAILNYWAQNKSYHLIHPLIHKELGNEMAFRINK